MHMACRTGITTNLNRRRAEHENDYPTLSNWRVFGPYPTRQEAQQCENDIKKKYGCEASGGGRDPDDPNLPWHCYYFAF